MIERAVYSISDRPWSMTNSPSPAAETIRRPLRVDSILVFVSLAVSKLFFLTSCLFLASGWIYNVSPVRTKDRAYLDVTSEALNNPIRLTLGILPRPHGRNRLRRPARETLRFLSRPRGRRAAPC